MKPLVMAVIKKSTEGKRGEALGGTESRRDLPVRFRCGKCWLPVDSIRASSGSHIGETSEKREESKKGRRRNRKGEEREREGDERRVGREKTECRGKDKHSWRCRRGLERLHTCHFKPSIHPYNDHGFLSPGFDDIPTVIRLLHCKANVHTVWVCVRLCAQVPINLVAVKTSYTCRNKVLLNFWGNFCPGSNMTSRSTKIGTQV